MVDLSSSRLSAGGAEPCEAFSVDPDFLDARPGLRILEVCPPSLSHTRTACDRRLLESRASNWSVDARKGAACGDAGGVASQQQPALRAADVGQCVAFVLCA